MPQIWSRIHISDLISLYGLLVNAIITQNPHLPSGKPGFYFAENGNQSWRYISERIGKTAKEIGAFETDAVADLSLKDAADEFYEGDLRHCEGVLASK